MYELNIKASKAFATSITNALINNDFTPALVIQGLGLNINTVSNYYRALCINNISEINESTNNIVPPSISNTTNAKYFVYILVCNDSSYYTGYTSNLEKRINQHNNGTGSKYTKTRTPVRLVYYEEFSDKSLAMKRERQIKKLAVYEKEQLIEKSRME